MTETLITGGSGFIGSHIVDRLLDGGNEVSVLDIVELHRKDVKFFKGSILSSQDLMDALRGTDYVFHLAGMSDINNAGRTPGKTVELNITGTLNVLDAARKAGVNRVLFASTIYAREPGEIYGKTKKACEMLLEKYKETYGLAYTILRYGSTYGPRSRGVDVVSIFVKRALKGEPLIIHGSGKQTRKFIYVEDLAESNVAAMKKIAENRTYDLLGDESISVLDVAETVRKVTGKNVPLKFEKGRNVDYRGETGSNESTKKDLGWEPETSFKEGVRKYVEWYLESQKASSPASRR
jgi:UDP-glucose 4-epimerase